MDNRFNLGVKFLTHLNELIVQETLGEQVQEAALKLRKANELLYQAKNIDADPAAAKK